MNSLNNITNDENMMRYCNDYKKYERLTEEEERLLAKKARRGDVGARNKLVECNLGLVASIALRYSGYCDRYNTIEIGDLVQAGNIGILIAAERYDPDTYGTRFSALAVEYIKSHILDFIVADANTVHVPHKAQVSLKVAKRTADRMAQEKCRDVSIAEAAATLTDKYPGMESPSCFNASITSLDKSYGSTEDEDGDFCPADLLSSDMATDSMIMEESSAAEIEMMLDKLKNRDADVLSDFFGIGGRRQKQPWEIAEDMGITKTRVLQIVNESIGQLRSLLPMSA